MPERNLYLWFCCRGQRSACHQDQVLSRDDVRVKLPNGFAQQAPRAIPPNGVPYLATGRDANAGVRHIIGQRPHNKQGMPPRPSLGPNVPELLWTAQAHFLVPTTMLQQCCVRQLPAMPPTRLVTATWSQCGFFPIQTLGAPQAHGDQFPAALEATALQNVPSGTRFHTRAETVGPHSFTFLGLISSLRHSCLLLLSIIPDQECRDCNSALQ